MTTFLILFQKLLPHHLLTKLAGLLSNCQYKPLKNFLINLYLWLYQVNMDEAESADINDYKSFNAFFTRHLKASARPLEKSAKAMVAPVDGTIYQFGKIEKEQLFYAKGFDFTLTELLAGFDDMAAPFVNGDFICMYLAPYDYHRIHMPYTGHLQKMVVVPGSLYSVDPTIVSAIPKVFARNERVICLFETNFGPMAMILIGAVNVGSIHTVWADGINSEHGKKIITTDYTDADIQLEKGAEMGHFQMGSTVITLFPREIIQWSKETQANTHKNYGEALGNIEN